MSEEDFWERKEKRSKVYIIEAKISGFWRPVGVFYGEPTVIEEKREQLKEQILNILIANGLNAEDMLVHQASPDTLVLFYPKLESTSFVISFPFL